MVYKRQKLNVLLLDCYSLPPPHARTHIHRLDSQLHDYREGEWAAMREEADELRRDIVQYNILELVTKLEDLGCRLKSLATEVGMQLLKCQDMCMYLQ